MSMHRNLSRFGHGLAVYSLATALLVMNGRAPAGAEAPTAVPGDTNVERGKGDGKGGGRGTGGGGGRGSGGGAPEKASTGVAPLETIKGEVVAVDGSNAGAAGAAGERPQEKGMRPGPMISVRTEKETLSVHAGAPHFRQEQKLDLKVGDVIEISGVRSAKVPNMFVAHSITRGSQVVRLRDDKGDKLWKPRQRAQEPAVAEFQGRVVALDATAARSPGSGLGRGSQFVVVRADKEELAIEVGPEAYRQEKGLTLALDDEVTVSGWRLPSAQTAGKPIVLAASVTKGKTVVKLRDDRRRPLWAKKK